MASSSSSRCTKNISPSERNASPSRWISDSDARERYICWKNIKEVVPHKSIELSLFRTEDFTFLEKLDHQGLRTFVQMKGDCYPNLVNVFYINLKVVNGDIHSRVKGVDIVINNDTWLQVANLINEGRMSHLPDCLQKRWTRKTQMFKDCMRIPTNWVTVFKWRIIDVGINDWFDLPYGVFISKLLSLSDINLTSETKVTCNKANQIGKAILTCIGLKKIALGWIFSNEQDTTKNQDELHDSNNEHTLPSPMSEFEKFMAKRFEKVSKRANLMKKSLMKMNEKMDEIIEIYVESSTSIEESIDKDDETSEENSMDSSET
ncbi:hypothetical protein LR48_Vigan07g190700 [Vigna angularis]|uniref:Uncharacterized protein n=1 Tax=Phaseolus angularis TaxID=3914 RepID=A0A0L9UZI9_PHAAN|nr:hypothetical protein LR48_Vigan07g190700 [Vigna angularis]